MPLKPSKVYLNQKETKMKIFHGTIIYLIEHKITKNIRTLTQHKSINQHDPRSLYYSLDIAS